MAWNTSYNERTILIWHLPHLLSAFYREGISPMPNLRQKTVRVL